MSETRKELFDHLAKQGEEITLLREQLVAVTQDARRYQLLRALLRHSKWNDVDAIHEMKPEFEKYINDNNLDCALDCVINFEMEK